VLFIGGQKNHIGQVFPGQCPKNVKTIHAGHLDIEEHDIGGQGQDFSHCRRSVPAFSNDLDTFEFAQP
jgi:hypothetical protein